MTPPIHVGFVQHPIKRGPRARSLIVATPLGILRAKLQLGYGGQPYHCLFIAFLYNMSNMSLYLHVMHHLLE